MREALLRSAIQVIQHPVPSQWLLLVWALVACTSVPAPRTATTPIHAQHWIRVRHDFFVFGLVGRQTVDLRDQCGERPVKAIVIDSPGDSVLFGILTLGLVIPRQVSIQCEPEGTQ